MIRVGELGVEESEYRSGECAETSGFLFRHSCGEPAATECRECGKPICKRHSVHEEGGLWCTTCAKQLFRDDELRGRRYYDDDPYFYSTYHYTDYYDDTDFTESEAVLTGGEAGEEDVETFEDDMGAS